MKAKSFWALLKFEARASFTLFIYPIIFGWQNWFFAPRIYFPIYTMAATSAFGVGMVAIFSYSQLFQGNFGWSQIGWSQKNTALMRTPEFPFTRAISRRALYGAKTTLLVGLVGLTFLPAVCGALSLSQAGRAALFGLMSWLLMALYAALMFGTIKFPRFQRFFPFVALFIVILGPFGLLLARSSSPSSSFKRTLAWGASHPAISVLAAVLLMGISLWFGCRKFVAQEVID